MGKYFVKGVKTLRGREGYGLECSIWKTETGKKVATYVDWGDGGGGIARFAISKNRTDAVIAREKAEEAEFYAHVKSLPEEEVYGTMLKPSADMYVDSLAQAYDAVRIAKKETYFRIPGKEYSSGSWTAMNVAYSDDVRAEIEMKYGKCEFHIDMIKKVA